MAKNFFEYVIPVMVLVFGMAAVGCDNGSTGKESDTWSNVTDLNQLNGTWRTSYRETMTVRQYFGEEFYSEMQTLLGNMNVTFNVELVVNINMQAKTVGLSGVTTIIFSGGNINTAWSAIKSMFLSDGNTFNDSNRSITWTWQDPTEVFTDAEINQMINGGLEINRTGTKIRVPENFWVYDTPVLVLTKS